MVMFGVFAMWLLGVMTYLIPRILKTPWYSHQLLEWHYWLSTIGILVMSADLITLGVFQGLSWSSLMPWDVSIELSIPFWLGAAGGGAVDVHRACSCSCSISSRPGHACCAWASVKLRCQAPERCQRIFRSMLESKTGVFFIAGLGFFALAFLSNAVVPVVMYRHLPEQTVEQMLEKNGNLRYQFEDLARRFPDSFTAAYGRPPEDAGRARSLARTATAAMHSGRAARSTSARAAGTAIASSSGPSPTKNGAGDQFQRPRNTRTSCNAP